MRGNGNATPVGSDGEGAPTEGENGGTPGGARQVARSKRRALSAEVTAKPSPERSGSKTESFNMKQVLEKMSQLRVGGEGGAPAKSPTPRPTAYAQPPAFPSPGSPVVESGTRAEQEEVLGTGDEESPSSMAQPRGAAHEKPRLAVILTAAGIMLVLFILLWLLKAGTKTQVATQALEMFPNACTVLHERWDEGNPIVTLTIDDPDVVACETFLVPEDVAHILVKALYAGEAKVTLHYKNGNRKVTMLTVTDKKRPKQELSLASRSEMIERAKVMIKSADSLFADREKNDENYYKALATYRDAIDLLKNLKLYYFLPTYREACEKARRADEELTEFYKKAYQEYEMAHIRKSTSKAKRLLERLLAILPDENDERYLKNKTFLEYEYD